MTMFLLQMRITVQTIILMLSIEKLWQSTSLPGQGESLALTLLQVSREELGKQTQGMVAV